MRDMPVCCVVVVVAGAGRAREASIGCTVATASSIVGTVAAPWRMEFYLRNKGHSRRPMGSGKGKEKVFMICKNHPPAPFHQALRKEFAHDHHLNLILIRPDDWAAGRYDRAWTAWTHSVCGALPGRGRGEARCRAEQQCVFVCI